jgi:hypothetical protein
MYATHIARLVLVTVMALFVTLSAQRVFPDDGGRPFTTTLLGANEVPGLGDPDGSDTATLRLNPGQEEICYELTTMSTSIMRNSPLARYGVNSPSSGCAAHTAAAGTRLPSTRQTI